MPRDFIPCVYREEERTDIEGLAWYLYGSILTLHETPDGWELTGESHGSYRDAWEEAGHARIDGEPSHETQRQWMRELLGMALYHVDVREP